MHATVAAVVLGGSQEAADAARRRPPASPLAQVEAVGRALPRVPAIPADLLAQHALQDAAAAAAAAAGAEVEAPDCLEACCLRDDLHLFMPAGPACTLLTWARLPLPLLYEGGQFSYPLRQVGLPAPLLQLALNGRASAGWASCLWHTNLPMLAARSEYALTLLQLAPGAPAASEGQEQRQQARARSPDEDGSGSGSGSDGNREAEQEGSEEWEDDGGGFDLCQLCVFGTRRPTAHACWQRHLAQQPLLLLDDGTLLEAQLQQDVQVVEAWKPPEDAVPSRLRGVLQVAGGAQPRTAVLALRDRLSRLDLRTSGGRLAQLWHCPQAQHLTAICAPPAGDAPGSSAAEHLLAAATGSSAAGGAARVLLFDLRRPGQPVATWDQPRLGEQGFEAGTLLRWLPTALSSAGMAGSGASQQRQRLEAGQARRGGLLVAGSSAGGQVVGCQFAEQAAGPTLQARDGRIQEKPATAAAALLERLQASLEQQQQAQQAQQAGGDDGEVPPQAAGAEAVLAPLQPPPAFPTALQLLWQPAHSCGFAPVPPGTPVLLQPPAEQQMVLQRSTDAGRLRLRKLQAVSGAAIQAPDFEPASERRQQPCQLAGLAAVAADWATGQELLVPLLCSLMPRGDAVLSLLRDSQGEEAVQQGAALAAAPPVLLPLGQGQHENADGSEEGEQLGRAAAADGTRLLPYIRGVPRQVVAAVADGTLHACGCCKDCLKQQYTCQTRVALRQAGLLERAGREWRSNQASATLPAGESGRSIVQLPLHTALVQRLLTEGANPPGQQPPSQQQQQQRRQQQQQQHSVAALDSLLLRLRRGCISLGELQAALRLLPPAGRDQAASSSSSSSSSSSGGSEDEGRSHAVSAVRRVQREARRQVRRDWRQRRRQERHTLHEAQQAALAALLEGPLAAAAAADASKLGPVVRRRRQRRSGKGKRSAAAEGQQLTPSAAEFEGLLQRAGLLPPQPPSGLAGEQGWLQYQSQQQQQEQQQASGEPIEQLPLVAPSVASLREQLSAALHRPAAQQAAAAAAAAALLPGGSGQPQEGAAGQPEWQLGARSFVLTRLPGPADGQQQQQMAAEQPAAAPQLQVQRAGTAADVLSLVRVVQHEAGPSTSAAAAAAGRGGSGAPAPWLGLQGPDPPLTEDGAAALAELRAAWG